MGGLGMRRSCILTAWICGALLLLHAGAATVAEAQEPPASPDGPNIKITMTSGKVEEGSDPTEKSYRLIARADGPPARLLMGWRMPIPTTQSLGAPDSNDQEISFVYQNVGMSAHFETRLLAADRILVRGVVEISGKRGGLETEPDPSDPPVIGTFQQELSVVLRDGEPLRVAEVPDPEGGTLFLDLLVEVMR